jgi:ADP-ribose pyrophosphatase YjhB (NUDIX family)
MKLPLFIGKVVYIVTKPAIYHMLKGSKRVYVVIKVNDEILVTKNWLGLHKTWRLPGGGMQANETPLQALKREVHEELGIELEENKLMTLQNEPCTEPVKKFEYFLYFLEYTEKPQLFVNEKEIVASEWIPLPALATQPVSEELNVALNLVK